jgi:hypothetical protein
MSGKYVSQKPTRGYNDPAPGVVRGKRVTMEAFAKAGALRNLAPQTMENYGKTDYLSYVPIHLTKQLDEK